MRRLKSAIGETVQHRRNAAAWNLTGSMAVLSFHVPGAAGWRPRSADREDP
jgi:hypothetical protein